MRKGLHNGAVADYLKNCLASVPVQLSTALYLILLFSWSGHHATSKLQCSKAIATGDAEHIPCSISTWRCNSTSIYTPSAPSRGRGPYATVVQQTVSSASWRCRSIVHRKRRLRILVPAA